MKLSLSVRTLASAAVVALACALEGCLAATAAGAGALAAAGTYAYERGELHTTIDAPLDDVYRASLTALEQLELPVVDRAKDALNGHITATQANGTRVKVDLGRESDNVTRIGVRVGTFGDEPKSRLVLARIREAL